MKMKDGLYKRHIYLKTWMEQFMLNIQNDGEESTENMRVLENGNTSDKVETYVLDLEMATTQIKIVDHLDMTKYL
jgi:hypothetical protein